MQGKSSEHTKQKLESLLADVGDMALKRRARKIVLGLELKNGDKILDAGCGNGHYLYLLSRIGDFDLTGIDNDRRAIKDAKLFVDDKTVRYDFGTLKRLPYKNNSFDKVLLTEVVEHIKDDAKAVGEIYRVLKPGGLILFSTTSIDYPFFWDPVNFILQRLGLHFRKGFLAGIWNQHLRLYKPGGVARLLTNAGFYITNQRNLTYWCLPFNHYALNFAARLLHGNFLPARISDSVNKFEHKKKITVIDLAFRIMNWVDSLNDSLPMSHGVTIYAKAKK